MLYSDVPWEVLRDQLRADPVKNERYEPMRRAMADGVRLGKLREARRKTQVQLAEAIGTTQANVSRLETRDDLYLSTLNEYVEALGGYLELRAVFPDEVLLIDVAAVKEPAAAR
ncbi:MAG TPA: helix-turn-helix transcriptional regulator [Chloroflexota bacterium]|nr:helix-turn-helix transcriptional regulator [Chloroflexota bacterium]